MLQIIPRLEGGGAEATTVEISRALTAAGGQSFVATQGGAMVDDVRRAGGEVFSLRVASKNPWRMWRNVKYLHQLCVAMNIDIIHARSRAPAWSAFFAAKRAGVDFVTTYHSKVHTRPRLKVFYNSIMVRGVKVIANSAFTAKRIAAVHGTAKENIVTIPRGCDAARFDARQFSDGAIQKRRTAWGVGADDVLLICPARLTRWKGQEILIDALGDVVAGDRGAKVKLLFIGGDKKSGAYAADLKARAAQAGISDKIIFVGHVAAADMPLAYAAGDVAVLPSLEAEPFGRTAIEAQAAGLPVIASDAGGFCETVKMAGEIAADSPAQGWRVAAGDKAALADALRHALSLTPQARRTMGAAARDFVAHHYTLEAMCDKTLRLYLDIQRGRKT